MSDDYKPDPFKNFTPRQNPPATAAPAAPILDLSGLSDDEISAKLDALGLEEMKALVRRLLCQCGAVALLSREETAQAMLDELARLALRPIRTDKNLWPDVQQRMAAIDKWLDRERGKPVQAVVQANINAPGDLADRCRALLAQGVVSQHLLDICKQLGVDTSAYDLKMIGRVIENNPA